jgi:nitrite reductase/ring-hydroxylating ferredoxin subunit
VVPAPVNPATNSPQPATISTSPCPIEQVTQAGLEIGAMCSVLTERGEQLLCRVTEEDWVLTDALCTHGDARLVDGILQGWTLECPRHNGRFDLHDGRAVRRPATVDLEVTRVTPPPE